MSVHKKPGGQMNRDRYSELKRILEERRREIMEQVQEKIRDVRTEGANNPNQGVLDAVESSEADIQDDIEFALIQMKSETLNKIRRRCTAWRTAPSATASSAGRRSPSAACGRCRSRSAARTAKRRVSRHSSASACSRSAAAHRHCSWTCRADQRPESRHRRAKQARPLRPFSLVPMTSFSSTTPDL